jgi:hypothetical protein
VGQVPFSIYDALGYLSAGSILLAAATIALIGELPSEVSLVAGIAIAIAAYIVGHIVASISSWAFDRILLNHRWGMGLPERVLFGQRGSRSLWRVLFRRYYQALPEPVQKRVLDRAESEPAVDTDGEGYPAGLLQHCEAVVQGHQTYGPRVDRYETLTAFLRNSCAAFAGAAVILALAPEEHAIELQAARGGPAILSTDLLALLSLLASVVLLFRYVQMFAEWRREVFILYAEMD